MSAVHGIPAPRSAWMWKPKSKVTDENVGTGVLGFGQSMFGALRNNISVSGWNRRHLSVDGAALHYGKSVGQREKSIALETIKGAQVATREEMRAQKAPEQFVDCGWKLLVVGKDYLFCAEEAEVRNEWVNYIDRLVAALSGANASQAAARARRMTTIDASAASFDTGDKEGGANRSGDNDDDQDHDDSGTYGTTTAQMIARAQDLERERATQRSTAAPFSPSAAAAAPDDDDDAVSTSPLMNHTKSQTELRQLVGGTGAAAGDDEDDDVDFEKILAEDEDDDSDDAGDDGDEGDGGDGSQSGAAPARRETKEDQYHRFLMPLAQTPYSHIQYKLSAYASHLQPDDSLSNVLFSREVDKIGKRDTSDKRDLVLTTKYLYLLSKGMFGNVVARPVVPLDQLVGVIESTIEPELLAIIIPSFHDVLIRITSQKSLIPGNEVQVKHQLIAHLYAACKRLGTGRQFLFREAENVRSLIRRSDLAPFDPLASTPGDALNCAKREKLFPTFRLNADSTVLWSSIVHRINAKRATTRCAIVVADSAVYFVTDDLKHIEHRSPLRDTIKILYDVDMQGILLKSVEVDCLFTVKDPTEFAQLKAALVDACSAVGNRVRAVASKALFSNAQLVETRKLQKALGENAKGLKKAGKRATRWLLSSVKMSLKGVDFVTNSVAKVGEVGVDLLKSTGKELGGVLVDNQLAGELLGVMGSTATRMLNQQYKILFETLINYQDEEALLRSADPFVDQLKICQTPQVAEHKVGTVGYSSRCALFNLTATIDLYKTENRLIVVSPSGVFLFFPPDAAFSLLSPLRGIVAQLSKGLRLDTKVEWSSITGVVRCSLDDNVVGVQTNSQRHSDIMLRLPNASLVAKFVSVAALFSSRSSPLTKRFQRHMLQVYSAPKMENVRSALKKNLIDAKWSPTIALRSVPTTGDALQFATFPDIADTIRRSGDNTIYFSGLAWRLRSSSTKKGSDKVGEMLKDDDTKSDNRVFKSFNLVLTNCAIYQITKGGLDIVRRTDVRDITKVAVAKNDPNSILLVIPTEYDVFFRVEGRGREFLDRLAEAYATWTTFGLRYATQLDTVQHEVDFFVPIVTVDDIASVGKLEKPPHFSDEQASRAAAEILVQYHQWHKNQLTTAILRYREAMEAAAKGMIFEPENVPGYDVTVAATPRFRDIFVGMENTVVAVRFVQERAYRFGLRAATCTELAAAQRILLEWADVTAVAEDLQLAIEEEDIDRYEERHRDLDGFPAFSRLLAEQSGVCETLQRKKETLKSITEILGDYNECIEAREEELAAAFQAAAHAHVKPATIASLRQQADRRLQKERLAATLVQLSADGGIQALPVGTKHLLRDAALRLQLDSTLVESAFGAGAARKNSVVHGDSAALSLLTDPATGYCIDRPRIKAASSAIRKAVEHGDGKLLSDAITSGKAILGKAQQHRGSLRAAILAAVEELEVELHDGEVQQDILSQHDEVARDLNQLRRLLRTRVLRGLDVDELTAYVAELAQQEATLQVLFRKLQAESVRSAPVLDRLRSLCDMLQRKIGEKMLLAKEELRYGHREAQALADAREHQRKCEEAERQRLEEEQQKAALSAHNRRMEFFAMWQARSQKLVTSLKSAIATRDVGMVKQCIRNCLVFQGDAKTGFQTHTAGTTVAAASSSTLAAAATLSAEHEAAYAAQMEDIVKRLASAAKRGQAFLDEMEPTAGGRNGMSTGNSNGTNESGGGNGSGSSNCENTTVAVPPELMYLMEQSTTAEIIQFLQERQGTLNMATIAEVRRLWTHAKTKRVWIAKLHKSLHTAFALNNAQLLQDAIRVATAAEYSDDDVCGAIEILKIMKAEEEAKQQQQAAATNTPGKQAQAGNSTDDGVEGRPSTAASPEAQRPLSAPTVSIPPLSQTFSTAPAGSTGYVVGHLHKALVVLSNSPTNTCGRQHPERPLPQDDTTEIRQVVQTWVAVLEHRAKPSGIFRKVDRGLMDVLLWVGNFKRSGDFVAPYTNRLCSDFERIKKFNNPNGHSSSYVLMSYLLLRDAVSTVLSEFRRIGAKDLGDLFYDDSLHRSAVATSELPALGDVCSQFEWPFSIQERSSASTSVSLARTAEQALLESSSNATLPDGRKATAGGASASSYQSADGTDPNASPEQRKKDAALMATTMLRLAIGATSKIFAQQLKLLSSRQGAVAPGTSKSSASGMADASAPVTATARNILDERLCKEIGVVTREQLCPALMAVLHSGLRSYHLLSKRRLWDALSALGEHLRESARALGGVGLPDAVDMVMNITDANGRNKAAVHRMDDDQLSDVRCRMLIVHCLNQRMLTALFESMFDESTGHAEFLKRYYATERCMMVPLSTSESAIEVMKIVRLLNQMPFSLSVDAEIW